MTGYLVDHRAAHRRPVRGFTLIEVIVALAILSLVMLATISALRTFGNTQSSLDKLTGRIDDVRTISGFLRDTLGSAVGGERQSAFNFGGSIDLAYFEGTSNLLAWKAPVLFGEGYGGIYLVRLAQEERQLVLRWQEPPISKVAVEWSDTASRVVLENLEEFHVAYRPEFNEDWQTDWELDGSPAVVKLTIKVGGRYWPELIVQVQR